MTWSASDFSDEVYGLLLQLQLVPEAQEDDDCETQARLACAAIDELADRAWARRYQDGDLLHPSSLGLVAFVSLRTVVEESDVDAWQSAWRWFASAASWQHRHNGEDGIREFGVNLARELPEAPAVLRPLLEEARRKRLDCLVVHQDM
ncbi:hypothetical protein [Rugamonas aquatica]|uniref:DUF4259 domain-containing protein n=1 Tax=Rugamonas aquatica TaxID=2743357 RepID=A0A6A7N6L7_9BURK|nr:hypothetical protein [Rugamonas aquatica]MQA40629.1 hypothetical protein [Rugamonas aquatica]